MYADPVPQAAMRAAIDSGQTRMSGMVSLEQGGAAPVPGLLLYSPVYDTVLPPADAPQRRLAMKGWVYAPFRVGTMLQAAIAPAVDNDAGAIGGSVVLRESPTVTYTPL